MFSWLRLDPRRRRFVVAGRGYDTWMPCQNLWIFQLVPLTYLEIPSRAEKREGEKVQSSPVGKLISSFFHFEHPHALLYIAGPAGMQNKHKDPAFDNMVERNINIIDFF